MADGHIGALDIAGAALAAGALAAWCHVIGTRAIRDEPHANIPSTRAGRLVLDKRTGPVVAAGLAACAGALVAWRSPDAAAVPALLILTGVSASLALIDATTRRLPRVLMMPATLGCLAALALASYATGRLWPLGGALVDATALGGLFTVTAMATRRLGGGDVRLVVLVGLNLGYLAWSTALLATLGGLILFAITDAATAAAGRRSVRDPFPLAPSLLTAAALAVCLAR